MGEGPSVRAGGYVGTVDLLYKRDHGYIGQALNQNLLLVDGHGNPATSGPLVKGFQYDYDAYSAVVTRQHC